MFPVNQVVARNDLAIAWEMGTLRLPTEDTDHSTPWYACFFATQGLLGCGFTNVFSKYWRTIPMLTPSRQQVTLGNGCHYAISVVHFSQVLFPFLFFNMRLIRAATNPMLTLSGQEVTMENGCHYAVSVLRFPQVLFPFLVSHYGGDRGPR